MQSYGTYLNYCRFFHEWSSLFNSFSMRRHIYFGNPVGTYTGAKRRYILFILPILLTAYTYLTCRHLTHMISLKVNRLSLTTICVRLRTSYSYDISTALSTPGVQAQKVMGRSVINKLNNADLVVDGRPHHVIQVPRSTKFVLKF
jgi:hypothetical protein